VKLKKQLGSVVIVGICILAKRHLKYAQYVPTQKPFLKLEQLIIKKPIGGKRPLKN